MIAILFYFCDNASSLFLCEEHSQLELRITHKCVTYVSTTVDPGPPPLSHHKVITSDDRGGSPPSKGDDWVMPDPGQVMTGVGHVRL